MTKAAKATPSGKRRPTADDMPEFMLLIFEGKALRAACAALGLDPSSTHTFIAADSALRQQYAQAREGRAELQQEQAVALAMAAATGVTYEGRKIDPAGARVALDAIKWSTARMAPRTHGEKLALEHTAPTGLVVKIKRYTADETPADAPDSPQA